MTAERPTLDTVAAAAGVSRMTVSNAYNRPDQLSAATRARVLAVAAELGYGGPDPAGRSLRRGSTGAVGMLLTESLPYAFTDPGLVEFLRGAAEELATAGQAMLLVPADPATGATHVASAIVDGFVVTSLPHDDAAFAAVRSRRLPYVVAGPSSTPGIVSVTLDNVAAARLAAEHLLSLGHRRIGVVGLPPTMPVVPDGRIVNARGGFSDRVTGIRRACEAAGLPSDAVVIEQAVTNSTAAGAAATTLLLARHPRPTAVFAVSDVLALGALAACGAAGLSIPSDVSVVGFDDIDEAQRSTPPLTTLHHGLDEQGRRAARSVLALIAGGRPRSWRATPRLVVRESTGLAPRRGR